jgi:Hypothetical protein (DUF2513)
MKRDIDLVKKILCHLEDSDTVYTEILLESYSPFPDYTDDVVSYHLTLMHEAGYIQGHIAIENDAHIVDWGELQLTWHGHEFLSILKDKEVLNKLASISNDGLTSMSFSVIKEIAKKLIENKAEKLLGLSK